MMTMLSLGLSTATLTMSSCLTKVGLSLIHMRACQYWSTRVLEYSSTRVHVYSSTVYIAIAILQYYCMQYIPWYSSSSIAICTLYSYMQLSISFSSWCSGDQHGTALVGSRRPLPHPADLVDTTRSSLCTDCNPYVYSLPLAFAVTRCLGAAVLLRVHIGRCRTRARRQAQGRAGRGPRVR